MSSGSISYDLSLYLRHELYVRGTENMSGSHHKLNSVTKPSLSLSVLSRHRTATLDLSCCPTPWGEPGKMLLKPLSQHSLWRQCSLLSSAVWLLDCIWGAVCTQLSPLLMWVFSIEVLNGKSWNRNNCLPSKWQSAARNVCWICGGSSS